MDESKNDEKNVSSDEAKTTKIAENEKDLIKPIEETPEREEKKEPEVSKSKEKPKKKKGKFFVMFILLIAIIAGIGAAVYFLAFATTTVDLSSCITIEYTGYDGNAIATASIDTTALADQLNDEDLAKKFVKKATLELNTSTNLSNGDEIEISIDIKESWLEDNKLKLKDDTVTITASGIDEPNSIDLSKYILVEYDGFNKNATADVSIDTDALGTFLENTELAEKFAKKLTLTIEDNDGLTNGEQLTINASIDQTWLDENGLEVQSNLITVEIAGLEEGTEIDVFQDINITTSGMSPNIKISVSTNSTDEFIKTVKYTLSKSTGISNGEVITVTAATWDKEMAKEKKYIVATTTYEYTVTAEVSYPMSVSELSTTTIENINAALLAQATSTANDFETKKLIHDNYTDYRIAGENAGYGETYVFWENDPQWQLDLTASTPELVAMYLLAAKDTSNSYNYVYSIYKVTYTSALTGLNYEWFITVEAKNLSVKSDGSITENAVYTVYTDNGSTQETAYNAYINDKKEDYTVESISF